MPVVVISMEKAKVHKTRCMSVYVVLPEVCLYALFLPHALQLYRCPPLYAPCPLLFSPAVADVSGVSS